ncbi:MAG TPA: Gmad2 immunoglobulin-like domain-containing protein [Nocardioidaceae bacterium]|nr:Gmad2 immunoglobulin-like domain-containing protein [Nocardioidaceae bacterium]
MNHFPDPSDDERMRRLLNEAVSDVEPRSSLDEIRSRTTSAGSTRRPWIWGAAAAAVATAATIAAVAMVGGSPGTTGAQDPGVADGSPTVEATGGTDQPSDGADEPTEPVTVPVYYVGETGQGARLFREFHTVTGGVGEAVGLALGEAVGTTPDDGDYRSDWPDGTSVDYLDEADGAGTLTVNLRNDQTILHNRPAGMSPENASLAIEQLIYTAQGATQTRDPVQFTLDGVRTDMVLGVPSSEPLAEGDPAEVLAQVWIIEPAEGSRVQSGFEVSGLANAFEANVQWELMQGDEVVKSGFTTAEECCTMSPYSFTVDAPPGGYTLVVHDSDPSGGEGFPPWEDTKSITITQ